MLRESQAGARGDGANLKLSWSQFESTFGAEELRSSATRTSSSAARSRAVASAKRTGRSSARRSRTSSTNVKPGNQTALNAAASPFAAYLAEMHRSIHREFAMRVLAGLPLVGGAVRGSDAASRGSSIVINSDGSLHQVGVVRTSGFTPFDYGAWNAVTRAAPFPEPPKQDPVRRRPRVHALGFL